VQGEHEMCTAQLTLPFMTLGVNNLLFGHLQKASSRHNIVNLASRNRTLLTMYEELRGHHADGGLFAAPCKWLRPDYSFMLREHCLTWYRSAFASSFPRFSSWRSHPPVHPANHASCVLRPSAKRPQWLTQVDPPSFQH